MSSLVNTMRARTLVAICVAGAGLTGPVGLAQAARGPSTPPGPQTKPVQSQNANDPAGSITGHKAH